MRTPPQCLEIIEAPEARTSGERLAVSGDEGGEPGGRPKRNTRTGFGGGLSPTRLEISATASSAGAACLPPKLKAGAGAGARAFAGGARITKGAGAGAAVLEGAGSAAALGALAAAGTPKLNTGVAPLAFSPENATHR